MTNPTEIGLMGFSEVEKIDPAQERALAGQGGPLPQEWLFDGDSAIESSAPSPDPDLEAQGVVDEVVAHELALDNDRVHTVNRKPVQKTMAIVLALGSLTGVGALLLLGLTRRPQPVTEAPEEEAVEELVFQDDSARLRSQLALQDQRTILEDLEAQDTELVVDEEPEDEVVSEPEPSPARPVVSSPSPRPVSQPAPRPAPRPTPTPSPAASAPPVDPFERWSQLAQLGTAQAGERQIDSAMATTPADGLAQAATEAQPTQSPFQRVSIGEPTLQLQSLPQSSAQPGLARPGFQASVRPQLPSPRPRSGQPRQPAAPGESNPSTLVASTPGTQGILDWHHHRQAQPSSPSPIQPELGTQVQAKVVTPMAWDLASGSAQSPDLGAGRFVIELEQDLTDSRGRVGLPQGTTLVVQASTVSPDHQLVQASAIAVVYPAGGQTVQQTLPEGALLVQGQGAQPLVAQRLNDLGPNLAAEDLLVGTLSALGQAGAVLNQPREEFRSAASGDSTSSTVIRTTRDPNLLGGVLEGFGSTISDRIRRRSEQNTQANIEANTVAVLPEGMAVTVVVNSFLEIAP
ncbi:hypothetical protein [Phormidium sp. FACHB-1136]|uniref:hypothetical protein n=1 Tax=Phormidium sp. FACHB-1136 TaxID=2692848 RepID=UPI001684D90C|nr:hypothetical protein [Phormidium sp. FACHB-1136]MBD2426982.1 hypothetical protein [Phormidium sp. FACHB-1136]